ncbi:MAG: 3'-5' exoribonuclease, partial [Rhodocyclaceae bacterium]|nr:3'-5' exoribonuclease [Rhodocyclaceae bacterium]
MFDQPIAFLDLETTGATAHADRITEIGIVSAQPGLTGVREWSTLVNPGMRIPPAIETLTGISNAMVADAPPFEALATELLERLEGRLLVAHNAPFDYGFLRNAFERAGIAFRSRVLCTVRLSRRLFPAQRRHNLDSIIARHGIACATRHRALADARVLHHFAEALRVDPGEAVVGQAVNELLRSPNLPPGLDALALDRIPEAPGVYTFRGEGNIALYVGKSVQLRSRVLSHFTSGHRVAKDMRIAQEVREVQWQETGGELGALLTEARLVKRLTPVYNRLLRRNDDLCALHWNPLSTTPPALVSAAQIDFGATRDLYGLFRSRTQALRALREIADAQGLCPRVLGLEKGGRGPCFSRQLHKCRGACCGEETPVAHGLRLAQALYRLRLESWPFPGAVGVRETSPSGRTWVHVLDRWCYLGSAENEADLHET